MADVEEDEEPSSIEPPIVEEPEELADTGSGWWWRWWHRERVRLADLTDDVAEDIGHCYMGGGGTKKLRGAKSEWGALKCENGDVMIQN